MSDLVQQRAHGNEANELLRYPAFQRACEVMEADCLHELRYSAPVEREKRETAYFQLQALDKMRRELQIALDNGVIAASALEKQES